MGRLFIQWRWADSNRRPTKPSICFLHAYSFFGCREEAAERQATSNLSFGAWGALKESAPASRLR